MRIIQGNLATEVFTPRGTQPDTSREAYNNLSDDTKTGHHQKIIDALKDHGPMTGEGIAIITGSKVTYT